MGHGTYRIAKAAAAIIIAGIVLNIGEGAAEIAIPGIKEALTGTHYSRAALWIAASAITYIMIGAIKKKRATHQRHSFTEESSSI